MGPPAPGSLAEELLSLWSRPKVGRPKSAGRAPSRSPTSAVSRAGAPVVEPWPPEPVPLLPPSTRFDDDFGRAIAYLRGPRSQYECAERGGLSRASWSLYEVGRRRPREGNLAKVLRGLAAPAINSNRPPGGSTAGAC
jgi:hypothetical protein